MNDNMKFPKEVTAVRERQIDILAAQAKAMGPERFHFFFGSIIAGLLCEMPEDYWQRFKVAQKCGTAGCDCHQTIVPQFMAALQAVRDFQSDKMDGVHTVSE